MTRLQTAFIRSGNIVCQTGFLESFTNYANNFALYNNFSYNKTPSVTLSTNNYVDINQVNPQYNLDVSGSTCIRQSLALNNSGLNNTNIISFDNNYIIQQIDSGGNYF